MFLPPLPFPAARGEGLFAYLLWGMLWVVGRPRLQAGQLGEVTVARVSRRPGGGWVRDPRGGKWQASVLVGRAVGTPRRVRTVADSKRAAVRRARGLAEEAVSAEQYANHTITPATLPGALWDAYRASEGWRGLAPRSRHLYQWSVHHSQEECPDWWATPISAAYTRPLLERLYAQHADEHGAACAKTLRAAVNNMARQAEDVLDTSRIHAVSAPRREVTKRNHVTRDGGRILSPQEFQRLATVLPGHARTPTERHAADAIVLNTFLGLRGGELITLTWDNINLDTGEVQGVESRKTRATYPAKTLPAWLTTMLRARYNAQRGLRERGDARVFPTAPASFYPASRRLLTRAGHPDITVHNIRKSVGSLVFDQYGARAAAAWLAHTNVNTTLQHYVKTGGAAPEGPITLYPPPETPTQDTSGAA